jgi:GNAT superfamily N-acetyltransferase
VLIETRPPTDPELTALVAAQQRELRDRELARGATDGSLATGDDARYLVVVVDGRAVACGAVQVLDPQTAELKRMYIRPAYRGRGIARQLLTALEELALAGGHPVLRLETGEYLYAAIALYTAAGYAPIPTYGQYVGNPFSVCFEKRLPSRRQA